MTDHPQYRLPHLCLFGLLALVVLFGNGCDALRLLDYKLSPNAPRYNGKLQLDGLSQPVEVAFDSHAIPHITAETEADLFFTVGFLHARERLFQMELLRRVGAGRLSELFGNQPDDPASPFKDTLAVDRWFRVIGLHRHAEAILQAMSAEDRTIGQAYVAGINRYIEQGPQPLEFRLLHHTPRPWTLTDVMTVARLQGWGISANMAQELMRFLIRQELGGDALAEMFPPFDHPGPYIITRNDKDYRQLLEKGPDGHAMWRVTADSGASGAATPGPSRELEKAVPDAKPQDPRTPPPPTAPPIQPSSPRGSLDINANPAHRVLAAFLDVRAATGFLLAPDASNNWVLAPSRTHSGKALLANDPHLTHMMPGAFYAMHLKGPDLDVLGVTMPGTPVIVLGHNRRLAWAATTTFADTQDIYLEKLDPKDPTRYLTPTGSEPFTVIEDALLEHQEDGTVTRHPLTLRLTRHGVVLNDIVPGMENKEPLLALKTTMDGAAGDLHSLLSLARADSVADFMKAFQSWTVPVQNWLAADDQGHIAYFPAGLVPRRVGWDGTEPVPGWNGRYEWDGMIPYDMLPQLVDPPSGMIVTANNKVVPPNDYPYPFSLDCMPGYRSARIVQALKAQTKWTAEEIRRLQTDVYVGQADVLLPTLLMALDQQSFDSQTQAALERLKSWDRQADVDSVGASIFFSTYRHVWESTLKDDLSPELYRLITGIPWLYGFFDHLWITYPKGRVFDRKDTPDWESRDEIMVAAFKTAIAELTQVLGADMNNWHWGRLHTLEVPHPFGSVDALRSTFNLGPVQHPGARGTVWAAGGLPQDNLGEAVTYGPVLRHVIDFGDPAHSGLVVDVGQSGWADTEHYGNAFDDWRNGRLWPVSLLDDAPPVSLIGKLQLTPAPK